LQQDKPAADLIRHRREWAALIAHSRRAKFKNTAMGLIAQSRAGQMRGADG
jgi:hypothetical protein